MASGDFCYIFCVICTLWDMTSGDPLYIFCVFYVFRYDLGSGPTVIRSADPIRMNTYHKVLARRFNTEGHLRIDNGPSVAGTSPGNLQSLNLQTDIYLGYVPKATQE